MLFLDELVDAHRPAVDVGAWWGPWTYWLSRRCPQVWAFEPNPGLAAVLRSVVGDNVQVEEVALSDRSGEMSLFVPRALGPDAQSTLDAAHRLEDSEEVRVALRPLDDYHLTDVGFLKVDVEAHEAEMLDGASKTLERCRPVVLIEIEQQFHETSISTIFDRFEAFGYAGWFRSQERWRPLAEFDIERDQLRTAQHPKSVDYVNNFVFTPDGHAPGT
jgi:FkbM family methyltransferase